MADRNCYNYARPAAPAPPSTILHTLYTVYTLASTLILIFQYNIRLVQLHGAAAKMPIVGPSILSLDLKFNLFEFKGTRGRIQKMRCKDLMLL